MVQKKRNFVGPENLVDHDAYHDVVFARAGKTQFDNQLCEFEQLLEENDEKDVDYIKFLMCILSKKENFVPPSSKKAKEINDNIIENDDCTDEENDPHYEIFLKNLKTHEKSYVIEYTRLGLPLVIKYEGESSLDEECDPEPRRRLRSAMNKEYGLPNQMPGVENQLKHAMKSTSVKMAKNLTQGKSSYEVTNQKVGAVKISNSEMVPDLEYLTFLQSSKPVGDYFVFSYGGNTVVYEKNHEEHNQEKENHDDEHSSDVEIIESTSFYNGANLNSSTIAASEVSKQMNKDSLQNLGGPNMQSEFRQQLITVLRKPCDKEEYHKLWQDVKVRKPEVRHKDLRGGRQYSYSTPITGKSYLDSYPDLKNCLLKIKNDKPTCLNLLRGFFFWLLKLDQEGSFKPWKDAQCLAIAPESHHPLISIKMKVER